jgi:type I site-specific restriction endonuclease
MATYEAWKKLEEEFGAQDVISVRDIFSYPEEPMDEEAKAILKRYKQGEKLTREEVLTLPYGMQEIYYLEREGELEAPELLRQRRMEERVANRRKQHEKEQAIYERVLRKNLGSVELTPQEIAIYNKFRSNAYSMDASEVNVNTVDLLNDIVKGDYTLVDVQIAQNGTEIRSVETSPMQLLEKVVEETKKRTQNALFTSDTAQFFPQIDSDASIRITPMQLDSIIATCTTGE